MGTDLPQPVPRILPGSSVHPVYEDSDKDYATIRELGEDVRDRAITALAATLPSDTAVIAINPTSFGGRRIGLLPDGSADRIIWSTRTAAA